ncbi:hypothetical protein HYU93_01850 [Candidatus Daviesbacteria bacterium]|nr:hypothetical protein [Candidatus Daviesbacteria bacterium]
MIRLLPIILVIILVIGGSGYWRFSASKPNLTNPTQAEDQTAIEVPKTLPGASLEDRVQSLEDTITELVPEVNSLKSPQPQTSSASFESRLSNIEAALTELKVRVSGLEKATPAPAAVSSKFPLYIPLGSGGGPWGDKGWFSLNEYQVAINSDNYSGYSSMQLEVNFRLVSQSGTASVRLYNVTDGSSISSQVDTTSDAFNLQTSGTFKLPAGQKTYTLQIKSTEGVNIFIQSARIKVNF